MKLKQSIAQVFGVGMLALVVGCSGFGDFTFDSESEEARIDGSASALPIALPTEGVLPPVKVNIDLQSQLEQRDADGADGVYLKGLKLRITDTARPEGDEDDFAFLDSVTLFIESSKAGSSLSKTKIASLPRQPQKGADQISFDVVDSVNLKPYVEEGALLTTEGKGSVPEDDVTFKVVTTLEVEVF